MDDMMRQIRAATQLLSVAVEAGLSVWPEGERLCVKGPVEAESIAKQILENKALLLPLLSDRRLEIVVCPGDDCEELVLIIDGEGFCTNHGMTITVIARVCA